MFSRLMVSLIVLATLLLVAAALFVQSQRPGASADRLQLVARNIVRGEDQMHVPDLTRRIIEDRRDFVLIDLRPVAAFQVEHIPGARHMTVTDLLQSETVRSMVRGRTLVLYDDGAAGTAQAAQAAALLRMAGVDAQVLRGGFGYWLRYTLDPESLLEEYADTFSPAERVAAACFFHGDYLPVAGLPVQTAPVVGYSPPVDSVPVAATAAAPIPDAAPPAADALGLGYGVGTVTPSVPVAAEPSDPLGLGLGLGAGTETPASPVYTPSVDALGLGLGLGVGVTAPALPAATPSTAPAVAAPPARRPGLRVGEGC